MRLPSPGSIHFVARALVGVLIVLVCCAFSAYVALVRVKEGMAGMGAAIGVFAGLYAVTVARSDFLRWAARRGVWPALLVTYGLRLALAVVVLLSEQLPFGLERAQAYDIYIGMLSIWIGGELFANNWTPAFNVFAVTMIDGFIQHVVLALVFLMVLLVIRPYCKEDADDPRGFDVLRPGQV